MRFALIILFISCKLYSQVSVTPSSTIACNQNFSSVNFTISSGTAPYSFTIQTPTCTSNYTTSSSNSNPTFTLPCAGVYTFSLKDATNTILGNVTHTVILSTQINLGVNGIVTGIGNDTICNGSSILIYAPDAPTYTLSNYNWSNGATGYSTFVSPTITTTYSINALYTSVYSKTCTAISSRTIIVNTCSGISTNNIISLINLFPNPFTNQLTISASTSELKKLIITNTLGQTVYTTEFYQSTYTFNIPHIPSGVYIASLYTNNQLTFKQKIIKQ